MLPLRLELHNFLAYRNPDPILLEDIHLACLSGMNGAGKSSLLDAITWVLWGKARTRSDDDMIHLGESEMAVTLDFQQDGHLYRVNRTRKIGKRKDGGRGMGTSMLTLFGYDDEVQAFKVITGGIKESQPQIDRLLSLTYEIFSNSAFLQQGKADTFTTQTPGERKKILSDILGLDRWADYEDEAKARLREITQEINVMTSRINDMDLQIKEEPALQRELAEAREILDEAHTAVELAEKNLDEVRGADIELRSAQEALASVQLNIKERQKDLTAIGEEINRNEERLAAFQDVLTHAETIKTGYSILEEARAADIELGDKLRDLNDINQRISKIESQIATAKQEIDLEIRELQARIQSDQDTLENSQAAHATLQEITERITELEDIEAERESQQAQIAELNEEAAELRTANKTLKEEMDEIKRRIDLIESATEPKCPVCGQPLDEEHRQQTIDDMTTQGTERGDVYRSNTARIQAIKEQVDDLKAEIKAAGTELKELPRLRSQSGGYEQQVQDAEAALERLQNNDIQLGQLQKRLDENAFAEELRAELADIGAERDSLGYDSSNHEEVRQTLSTYQAYQDRSRELDLAEQSVPQIQEGLTNAHARLERWQKNLDDYLAQAEEHQTEIENLEIKVLEMKRRQDEVSHQRTQMRNAEEKVISVEQSLKAIATLRERRVEMLKRREDLTIEEAIYDELKNAFGRNGIPAMIIEAVIPELEDATNRLLSRMSNNQMHIRFDTQRERKTGSGIIETLDIKIADELGTRDYSLYSGGEAFRINFALRIALSQLLARRAGAQLRTLFVDEGFGTQDAIGRERLVEAITAIQDDFDLILVITHIDDLKDAFPARIEVTKTVNGSVAVVR